MSFLKKITLIVFCSSLFFACTNPPPKRQPSFSARELAAWEMRRQPVQPVQLQPAPLGEPLVELPTVGTEPLREIDQPGKVPGIETLTSETPKDFGLNLPDEKPIHLDFEQIELHKFIYDIIATSLDISVIVDPTINDKISIRTAPDKPLTKQDLWPLLQLLLNDAGITMEKKEGVYHFKKMPSNLPGTISSKPDILTDTDSPEILQFTPLRYLSVESAQQVLNPLLQPKGRLLTLPTLNVIGIVTTPERLRRINKLLELMDANPFKHRGIRLFRLLNSKAAEVQQDLDKILKAIYGKTPQTYQVIALERINAIIIISPPGGDFQDVSNWVEILDERKEESREQVFIYKVRNLEATKLASTLSNVFKIEDKEEAEEKEKRRLREERQQTQPGKEGEKEEPSPLPIVPTVGKMPVSAELKVTIVADESTNSLLIRATPRDYRHLLETIYLLDEVPKEVMINVVLAEVTLTEATKFGIDWQFFLGGGRGSLGSNFNVPSGNIPAGRDAGDDGTSIATLSGLTFNYLSGSLNTLLNFIASTSDLKILARPSLLVRNNEEASINVGANEPFLSGVNTSTTSNQILSNDVQYKDTGITVKVTPRINDDGIINLKIFQELSQLGELRTTQNLQSFNQRKVETSVVVRDGNAIVIGGLIQSTQRDNQQGIPYLKDIPVLGRTLFSSTDVENVRIELVLIIVPKIIDPEADNRPLVYEFIQRIQMVDQLLNQQQMLEEL
jgi:general secretion pathway protein D